MPLRGRPRQLTGSFRSQLVLLTSAVTALGVLALTIVVQIVLSSSANRALDTVLQDRAETIVGAVTASDGRLRIPDEKLDAGVAVYDSAGRLVAGDVPRSEGSIYDDLSTTTSPRSTAHEGPDESRVHATPFSVGADLRGVVVVTERLEPYERAERQALYVSLAAGALMIALAAGLAHWVSRRALAPVIAMARAADDWSEHDLAHRFNTGARDDEIAALGRTLNLLLERVATAIRSEQRLTSELAHEMRTPLAAIRANADIALLQPDLPESARESLDEIVISSHRMGATIKSLLDLARTEATQASARSCCLLDAVREALAILDIENIAPVVDASLRVMVPSQLVVRAVTPLLENAIRLAELIEVSAVPSSRVGFVDIYVDDDGPGIPVGDHERIFEPGRTSGDGAGLGLALARRVARGMGGDLCAAEGHLGTRFVLTLPAV